MTPFSPSDSRSDAIPTWFWRFGLRFHTIRFANGFVWRLPQELQEPVVPKTIRRSCGGTWTPWENGRRIIAETEQGCFEGIPEDQLGEVCNISC